MCNASKKRCLVLFVSNWSDGVAVARSQTGTIGVRVNENGIDPHQK